MGHYNNCGRATLLGGALAGVRVVKMACAADCVMALGEEGEVFGWGNSEYGQLSAVTSEQQVGQRFSHGYEFRNKGWTWTVPALH